LKQGVKVDNLVLSKDFTILCGCGTYLSLVDRIFSDGEPASDMVGSTNFSDAAADEAKDKAASEAATEAASGFMERRLDPDKGENETFSMPVNGTNSTKHYGKSTDPRNGWATCWDVSRFTSGNISVAVEEGPPERIFRAKRGDEIYTVAFADDDSSLIIGGDDKKVRKYSIHTQTMLKEYNTTDTVLSLAVDEKAPAIVFAGLRNGEMVAIDMSLDDKKFSAGKLYNISYGQAVDAIMYYNFRDIPIVFTAGWKGKTDDVNGLSREYELPVPEEERNLDEEMLTPPIGDNPGRITVWNVESEGEPTEVSFMSMNGMSWVNTLAMSSDKRFLISGANDGSIVFWNPAVANTGKMAGIAKYKAGKWAEIGRAEIVGPEKRYSPNRILPKVDPNTPEDPNLRTGGHQKALARKAVGVTPPDVVAARGAGPS
jgi:hypothetical protein